MYHVDICHCSPQDSVLLFKDIKAKHGVELHEIQGSVREVWDAAILFVLTLVKECSLAAVMRLHVEGN